MAGTQMTIVPEDPPCPKPNCGRAVQVTETPTRAGGRWFRVFCPEHQIGAGGDTRAEASSKWAVIVKGWR
jgi:hypothetical protein